MVKLSIKKRILAAITLASISLSGLFRDAIIPAYSTDAPQATRIKSSVAPKPPTSATLPPPAIEDEKIEIEDRDVTVRSVRIRRPQPLRELHNKLPRPQPLGGFFRQLFRCR